MSARSTPVAPSFFHSTGSIARLTYLRTLRGRKLRVGLVAAVLVVLFPAVISLVADDVEATDVVTSGIDWGFYRLLVFLLPLMFTAGTVSEETEARTLHFLAMRPLHRASIALGKYLVGVGAALAIMWSALILLHVIGYATDPTAMIDQIGATARAGGGASLLLVTYCAITLFWGTLAPGIGTFISVMWLGFIEWFMVLVPYVFRFVSMNHFARELGGLERAGWDITDTLFEVPFIELQWCALVIVIEWLVFLGLALLIMQKSQLRFGKA